MSMQWALNLTAGVVGLTSPPPPPQRLRRLVSNGLRVEAALSGSAAVTNELTS